MAEWYYAQNDLQLGPVTAAALKDMAQHGRLRPDDLIWREGMQRWAPAHKVRGLFAASDAEKRSPGAPPVAAVANIDEAVMNGALVEEAETAIDALPLANQEESKLQLPLLDAPASANAARDDSNELVVFEPASPPPRAVESPAVRRPAEPVLEEHSARASDTKRLRVDAPAGGAQRASRSIALFVQTFLWMTSLLVIAAGGVIYLATVVMTHEAATRLTASGVYATCVVAAYFLASATQRLCHVLGQWFVADVQVKQRRNVRDRNWKRFQ